MTVNSLYAELDKKIPRELSCSWDNDGLMCAPIGEREVKKVLVALDVTEAAVRALLEFREENAPVLFSGGVTSSHLLKAALEAENHFFAPPAYTADNAIGTALLCAKGDRNG